MKIASFNVNSLRARLPIVLDWLKENAPDVLCVQETKVQDAGFPVQAFENSGYEFVFKGQKSYNGVAIFSRTQINNVRYGFDDEPKDESRLIMAEINGISIVNTYIPQGYMPDSEKFEYKLRWFSRLKEFFQENFKPSDSVIWVGDMNIAPEPIDVYDPVQLTGHVCFHPKVHKALQDVISWGFVDVFRMHCKDAGQYSFWDYRVRNTFKNNRGWRLDHIFATKPLAVKSTECYIDKKPRAAERPSDHTPVIAVFEI
jgi:exodeoxyribonuclease III